MPPSPKLAAVGSGDGDDSGGGAVLLQRLQDFLGVAGLLDPFQPRQQRQQQQRRRRGQQGQQPASSAVRLRTESGSGRSGRPGSAAAAAPGPRPYFWRLQQRLQAGGYRPGGQLGGATAAAVEERPVTEEDYVLLWRRQVYDQVRLLYRWCVCGGGPRVCVWKRANGASAQAVQPPLQQLCRACCGE